MLYNRKVFTFFLFLIIGCGLSSSIENCLSVGSKSAPGTVANANSSAENSIRASSLCLRSSRSLSNLALLLSAYKKLFSPYWNNVKSYKLYLLSYASRRVFIFNISLVLLDYIVYTFGKSFLRLFHLDNCSWGTADIDDVSVSIPIEWNSVASHELSDGELSSLILY
jgi:hypothetical protein